MFKMTLHYTRYALNLLAVVGFGSKLN